MIIWTSCDTMVKCWCGIYKPTLLKGVNIKYDIWCAACWWSQSKSIGSCVSLTNQHSLEAASLGPIFTQNRNATHVFRNTNLRVKTTNQFAYAVLRKVTRSTINLHYWKNTAQKSIVNFRYWTEVCTVLYICRRRQAGPCMGLQLMR